MDDEDDDIEEVEGVVVGLNSPPRSSSRSALPLVPDCKEPASLEHTSPECSSLTILSSPAPSFPCPPPCPSSSAAEERRSRPPRHLSPNPTPASVASQRVSPSLLPSVSSSSPAASSVPRDETKSINSETRSTSRSPSLGFTRDAPSQPSPSREKGKPPPSSASQAIASGEEGEKNSFSTELACSQSMQDAPSQKSLSHIKSSRVDTTENSCSGQDTLAVDLGARAVTKLLEVCIALLNPLSNNAEEQRHESSLLSTSVSFPLSSWTVSLLRKAQGTVFDFWPFTGMSQPSCLDEFCRLVARHQHAVSGSPTSCPTTTQSQEDDSGCCFPDRKSTRKGTPLTGQRSSILEPSVDEMDDIFAVLSSPSKSVERKKHSRSVQSSHRSSFSFSSSSVDCSVNDQNTHMTHRVGSPRTVSCYAASHPTESDAELAVSSHASREVLSLVDEDEEGDLDTSLPSAVIPRSGSSSSTEVPGIRNVLTSSSQDEENLPLYVWRSGKARNPVSAVSARSLNSSNSHGDTLPISTRTESEDGRDEPRSPSPSEIDVEEDSIATWAKSRRKRERERDDDSPPPSREISTTSDLSTSDTNNNRNNKVYTEECSSGAGKSDPFRVAMQRMQRVFDRSTNGQRKEATVVGGVSADELVRDLPPHLRRWFSRDFPFSRRIDSINREVFGHTDFRGLQLGAINAVMSGRDCFLVMPTGGGKSLCFQLPAYALGGLTLVVSPLLALMGDQLRSLRNLGVEATKIDGEMNKSELVRVYDELRQENFSLRILMSTPEFLSRSSAIHDVLQSLYGRGQLKLIVVDEAHCVCQWGEDFRSDYLSLGKLKKAYPEVPLLALTASASPDIFDEVKRILRIPNSVDFRMSVNRPNLFLEVREKTKQSIYEIVDMLSIPPLQHAAGIIYCLSIKDCETVASHLCTLGINAAPYHAKMQPRKRHQTQASWMEGEVDVIVSTVAFGLGVDRSDVRFVFHHSMPPSVERYYQEIGRAGRDGRASRCILFYSPTDVQRVSKLLVSRPKRGGGGSKGEKGRLERLEKMVLFCEASVECRRRLLLQAFGEDLKREDEGPDCGREDMKLGDDDEERESGGLMALSERAQQESRQMLKGNICARSCDNCWKKTHLAVQFHDVTEYAQKVMRLLLTQERLCPGGGYGSGLTRKQLCEAVKGCYSRKTALQSKLQQNEHVGCMKSITIKDIETLIRHMIKDQWLVETVVSMKGRFASYAVLRPGSSARTPLLGPRPLIVPNFQQPGQPRPSSTPSSSRESVLAAATSGVDLEKRERERSQGSAEWLSEDEIGGSYTKDEIPQILSSYSFDDGKRSQSATEERKRSVYADGDTGEEGVSGEVLSSTVSGEPSKRDSPSRSFARHLWTQKKRKVTVVMPEIEDEEARPEHSPEEKENVFIESHSDVSFPRLGDSSRGQCTVGKQLVQINIVRRVDKTGSDLRGDTEKTGAGDCVGGDADLLLRREYGGTHDISPRGGIVLLDEHRPPGPNHGKEIRRGQSSGSTICEDEGNALGMTAPSRLVGSGSADSIRMDQTSRENNLIDEKIDTDAGKRTARSSNGASAAELWRLLTDDAEEGNPDFRAVANKGHQDTQGSLSSAHSESKHNRALDAINEDNFGQDLGVTDVACRSQQELSRSSSPRLQRSQYHAKKTHQTTLTSFLRRPTPTGTGSTDDIAQPALSLSAAVGEDRVTPGQSTASNGETGKTGVAERGGTAHVEAGQRSVVKRRLPASWFARTGRR